MTRPEPPWLVRLRQAWTAAVSVPDGVPKPEVSYARDAIVDVDDLREAIGAAAPGPGSVALVGWGSEPGMLTIDYQTLLRFVHMTPAQAKNFAESILKQLHNAPHVAESRRLPAASQN